MKVGPLLLILTFVSDWSRWFIGPSRIAAANKETSPCLHDNFIIISHDFYVTRAWGRWLNRQEHLYNAQIVMNHRSCLRRLRGAVVSLNNELLKMESGVSDSRSIGSEAHMCWWAFHCRTGLISLQILPSETLIEFLTLHRREGTEDNIVHVCILFLIRYSACVVLISSFEFVPFMTVLQPLYHRALHIVAVIRVGSVFTHRAVCQVYGLMAVRCHRWAWPRQQSTLLPISSLIRN